MGHIIVLWECEFKMDFAKKLEGLIYDKQE